MTEISPAQLSERERKLKTRASIASIVISIILLVAKFWAFNMTKSQAVFSDALESIVNVVAASMALFVIFYSIKPKDQDHPYGHGKIEYFSATFEGGLITFAGFFIIVEAIRSFLDNNLIQDLGTGIGIVFAAGVVNLILGLFLFRIGKKHSSIALRASGTHIISDFWTSVGVSAGLIIALYTGLYWIDPIIAALVGALLLKTGVKLVRESIGGLMDEEDVPALQNLSKVLKKYAKDGIIQVHHVRMIRSGWYHHIDAHLVVPEFWDVKLLHDKLSKFENDVIKDYSTAGEMNFHLDPCRRAYCRVCDLEDCAIRTEMFEEYLPVSLEHLRSEDEPKEYK